MNIADQAARDRARRDLALTAQSTQTLTLNPNPETCVNSCETLNPKPQSLNPNPLTPLPKSQTLNPEPTPRWIADQAARDRARRVEPH